MLHKANGKQCECNGRRGAFGLSQRLSHDRSIVTCRFRS
jgi:hypothetical protein